MQADQARSPANGRANGHSSLSLEKGRGRTSTCRDAGATAVCRSSSTSAPQIFVLKIISAGLRCRTKGARKL